MIDHFDPQRGYDIERGALAKAWQEGALEVARGRLQPKLDAMWGRLDGHYRLPGGQ